MITITGRLTDNMGVSRHEEVSSVGAPGGRLIARSDTHHVALPADSYLDTQPSTIPLDVSHDEVVGEVHYLERRATGLYIVATSDVDEIADLDEDIYLSPSVLFAVDERSGSLVSGSDAELDGVALTFSPATYCQQPVTIVPADLHRAADYARCRPELRHCADTIDRAVNYHSRHQRGAPHVIADRTRPEPTRRLDNHPAFTTTKAGMPAGMRYSGGGSILAIR